MKDSQFISALYIYANNFKFDDITQSRFWGSLFNTTWRDKYTN